MAVRAYDLINVCRLARVKRLDVFLRAVAEVVRHRPETRAVLVGDGPLMSELIDLRDNLGLSRVVEFVGQQQDVPQWLTNSRVFLLTSDSEGVSLSVMEALTAGCVVVASDVGDLGDVVHQGENGYLLPRGDISAFAERLLVMLNHRGQLESLSVAARQRARDFSLMAASRQWESVLGIVEGNAETNRTHLDWKHESGLQGARRGRVARSNSNQVDIRT
jgi:glycosyltransferase involved in cell wall biosynthesis